MLSRRIRWGTCAGALHGEAARPLLCSCATAPGTTSRSFASEASGENSTFRADPIRWKYRYTLRHRLASAKCEEGPRDEMERAAAKLLRRPEKAAQIMSQLSPEQRRTVALSWALSELEEEFAKADKDRDGKLTYAEFKTWAVNVITTGPRKEEVQEATRQQLAFVALTSMVPFIGFGMVDNGLMVIYGDVIDSTLGVKLGMSMLASAALGNAISNVFGMMMHGTINKWALKLGLPDPHLTHAQRKLPRVHSWATGGSAVGVFVGCLAGMLPLLFMDQTKKEEERAAGKTSLKE